MGPQCHRNALVFGSCGSVLNTLRELTKLPDRLAGFKGAALQQGMEGERKRGRRDGKKGRGVDGAGERGRGRKEG